MGWLLRRKRKKQKEQRRAEKIVTEDDFRTEEEMDAFGDAGAFFQEPVVESERTVFQTVMRGQEIETKRKEHRVSKDGSAQAVTTTNIPVAACGKRIDEHGIAGFCDICDKAVCSEHVQYCQGFETIPCHKLLCPKHAIFMQEGGERKAYCTEHYNMHYYFGKNYTQESLFGRKKKDE
jgi:hypothetical protein